VAQFRLGDFLPLIVIKCLSSEISTSDSFAEGIANNDTSANNITTVTAKRTFPTKQSDSDDDGNNDNETNITRGDDKAICQECDVSLCYHYHDDNEEDMSDDESCFSDDGKSFSANNDFFIAMSFNETDNVEVYAQNLKTLYTMNLIMISALATW
jgi:hypothetical protein